jgi:hypothetical protein
MGPATIAVPSNTVTATASATAAADSPDAAGTARAPAAGRVPPGVRGPGVSLGGRFTPAGEQQGGKDDQAVS